MDCINRTGRYYANLSKMTKYGFDFPIEVINKNITRLTNQVWKMIPMCENGEDWRKQLDTMLLEIAGLNEIFIDNKEYLQILSKLEGLHIEEDIEFSLLRRTVFEVITLLSNCKINA